MLLRMHLCAAWQCMHAAAGPYNPIHATVIIASLCICMRVSANLHRRASAHTAITAAAHMLPVRVCGVHVLFFIDRHCTTAGCDGAIGVCVFLCV